jgi:hypothetical protein
MTIKNADTLKPRRSEELRRKKRKPRKAPCFNCFVEKRKRQRRLFE